MQHAFRRSSGEEQPIVSILLSAGCESGSARLDAGERRGGEAPLQGPLQCTTLASAFLQAAAECPDRPALVMGRRAYSYRWLLWAASEVCRRLLGSGQFAPRDRVVLLLENSAEYVAAFYGVLLARGVVVPLPPAVERHRLQHLLALCGARVVLSSPTAAERRLEWVRGPTQHASLGQAGPPSLPCAPGEAQAAPAPAMIIFTAGSTGEPKGVMLSDANLLANARSIVQYLPIRSDDRALAILPFCHAYGNAVLQTHILSGATLVVEGSLTFPQTVMDALRRGRATSLAGVPEVFHALLRASDLGRQPCPSLRYMTVAGGALAADKAREVAERIAPAEFYVMYGQTEATARLAYLQPDQLSLRPGSLGRAIPGVELRVVDEAGRDLPPSCPGELWARGPNVMLGYWNDPAATQAAIRDGWLRTGDIVSRDEEGYFYFHARTSELVKLQGVRFHPREVEDAIAAAFPVCRPLVVPFRHRDAHRLALFLVPRAAADVPLDDIRRWCLRELPRWKVPVLIEVLPQAPLTDALKLDRVALVRRAEAQANALAAGRLASGESCHEFDEHQERE